MKKLTLEEWIIRSNQKHNYKYDYSQVDYVNSRTKVKIICPEHGEFWQEPNSHIRGVGCWPCGKKSCVKSKTSTKEEFTKKANLIHNNFFDYSKCIYIKSSSKIVITCPIHGDFYQTPNLHLLGASCPKCSKKHQYTTEEWIDIANSIHYNKYDYSKVNYINANTPVIITCKDHGDFIQIPKGHVSVNKNGCPSCSSSKGEVLISSWLKENNIRYKSQFELITPEIARSTNLMKIDFFVVHNDKQFFIEYDGIQHFEYTPHFHKGGVIGFEKQQRRDKVLNEFCELHKDIVTLIRFNYKQSMSEIEIILNKFLNVKETKK